MTCLGVTASWKAAQHGQRSALPAYLLVSEKLDSKLEAFHLTTIIPFDLQTCGGRPYFNFTFCFELLRSFRHPTQFHFIKSSLINKHTRWPKGERKDRSMRRRWETPSKRKKKLFTGEAQGDVKMFRCSDILRKWNQMYYPFIWQQ